MANETKRNFLEKQFVPLVRKIDSSAIPRWGNMNVHQMVEHVSLLFKISTNEIHFAITTPSEHLPKYREFLLSEKEFRENTKAPFLPSEPLPVQHTTLAASLN